MPSFLIDELVNECELSLDRIDELATIFKTSLLSTASVWLRCPISRARSLASAMESLKI